MISIGRTNWLMVTNARHPILMDILFYEILISHGLIKDAEKYLTALDPIKPDQRAVLRTIAANIGSWGILTNAHVYYAAVGITVKTNEFAGLTSINYFTRIKREMAVIAKAAKLEPFPAVMLNGRIDAYLKSKYPDYISTKTI